MFTREIQGSFALNQMEKYKITSIVITDSKNKIIGLLHMHDILQAKVV